MARDFPLVTVEWEEGAFGAGGGLGVAGTGKLRTAGARKAKQVHRRKFWTVVD